MCERTIEGLRIRVNNLYGSITEVCETSHQGQLATEVVITMNYGGKPEELFLVLHDGKILDHTPKSRFHMIHVISGQYLDVTPREFA